jgi:uncharacterized membrane protein
MDWNNAAQSSTYQLDVIFTDLKGIVTNIVATIAFAGYGWLLSRQAPDGLFMLQAKNRTVGNAAFILSAALLYITCIFGVNLYFGTLDSYSIPNVYHRLITFGFGICVFWGYNKINRPAGWLPLIGAAICMMMHLFSYGLIVSLRNGTLNGKYEWWHLFAHWISVAALLYLVYLSIAFIRNNQQQFESSNKIVSWIIPALLVILFSLECQHLYIVGGFENYPVASLKQQYGKAVLTILWAVCSFALMYSGMKFKNKTLRLASLSLFTLALLKLFFADLKGISEGGKIAAFILLGVLLLTVSFMYQKLKKMIIDDVQA